MLNLSDKNRYYLGPEALIDALNRFFLPQFPECECEVEKSVPNGLFAFDENFFATALIKTLRAYLPSTPKKIAFDFEGETLKFKIIYPKSESIYQKSELTRLFLLCKCLYKVSGELDCSIITIEMKAEQNKDLRVYAVPPERLHQSLINALNAK